MRAEALVKDARDFLENLTGKSLEIQLALEDQLVGPNEVLEHRGHVGVLKETKTGKLLSMSAFSSGGGQLHRPVALEMDLGLGVWFDLGRGSTGVLATSWGINAFFSSPTG